MKDKDKPCMITFTNVQIECNERVEMSIPGYLLPITLHENNIALTCATLQANMVIIRRCRE